MGIRTTLVHHSLIINYLDLIPRTPFTVARQWSVCSMLKYYNICKMLVTLYDWLFLISDVRYWPEVEWLHRAKTYLWNVIEFYCHSFLLINEGTFLPYCKTHLPFHIRFRYWSAKISIRWNYYWTVCRVNSLFYYQEIITVIHYDMSGDLYRVYALFIVKVILTTFTFQVLTLTLMDLEKRSLFFCSVSVYYVTNIWWPYKFSPALSLSLSLSLSVCVCVCVCLSLSIVLSHFQALCSYRIGIFIKVIYIKSCE